MKVEIAIMGVVKHSIACPLNEMKKAIEKIPWKELALGLKDNKNKKNKKIEIICGNNILFNLNHNKFEDLVFNLFVLSNEKFLNYDYIYNEILNIYAKENFNSVLYNNLEKKLENKNKYYENLNKN